MSDVSLKIQLVHGVQFLGERKVDGEMSRNMYGHVEKMVSSLHMASLGSNKISKMAPSLPKIFPEMDADNI